MTNKPVAVWAGNSSSRTVTMELAGYLVEIRVTPNEYRWDFGDGNKKTTTSAGREPRYAHDADISHSYGESGKYTINLTTSYIGQFRVDGGPWEDIPGTADVPSTPVPIDIYRYVRYLVDEECEANPDGPDCP
ncbi:PKD domain-containing protein [Brevibacterium otitidis]|uniref:PKD domain-containing protein n=1 Tax=Brevibacterium otitidis TaxID=53364 RepID=A0ABV5X658_9MICO